MSKVSKLIGCIVNGEPVLNRQIEDEKFYTIDVEFRGTVIPVLFSECLGIKGFEKDTKVEVAGRLMSDVKQKKLPKFYIYASMITTTDMDVETTNIVSFSCQVTKVKEKSADSRCIDLLPLVASDISPIDTTSVLYLCARGTAARKLNSRERGYVISGEGYLKSFRDIYEIYITDIDNLDEILNT